MRVAAISDIHGNLPALEAAAAEIGREKVDAIVVAGDTVSGPWAAEVFDLVTELDALIVRGNADRLVLARDEEHLGVWSADRLGPRRLAAVASWPLALELTVDGLGSVLVCHSTPSSDEVLYTRITPAEEAAELFAGVRANVVVSGHTHMQYDRAVVGGPRIVNPGSIGLPYEGVPGAYWALLGPGVAFRRTEYDVEACVAAIRDLAAPVDDQLLESLLEPPDSTATTEYFESLRGA